MSNMDARAEGDRSLEERHAALWSGVEEWLGDPKAGEIRRRVAQDRSQILVGHGVKELGRRGVLSVVRPDLLASSSVLVDGWLSSKEAADLARTGDGEDIPAVPGYAQAELDWNRRARGLVRLTSQIDPSIVTLQVNEPVEPHEHDLFFIEPDNGADPLILQAKIRVGERLAKLSGSQLVGAE